MPSLDEHISYLRQLFEDEKEAQNKLDLRARTMNQADFDDNRERYERPVREVRDAIARALQARVLRYGPHYDRHSTALKKFHAVSPYEKSAFIMTKYPDGKDKQSGQLQKLIDLVAESLTNGGYEPRLADKKNYHNWIWDNVELQALGCCLGVAVVEDRYKSEFNPNVAMEWGWMHGMGRPVIFLVEKEFKHFRADVEGMIRQTFDWSILEETVPPAIAKGIKSLT